MPKIQRKTKLKKQNIRILTIVLVMNQRYENENDPFMFFIRKELTMFQYFLFDHLSFVNCTFISDYTYTTKNVVLMIE